MTTSEMASCMGDQPDDALYLGAEILDESALALSRSLHIIQRTIGYTENSHVSPKGYPVDWRGLAMLMKYSQNDIRQWENLRSDQAIAVINAWTKTAEAGATIKTLLDYFLQLQLRALLRNPNFIEAIIDDVGTYQQRLKQEAERKQRRVSPPSVSPPMSLQEARPEEFSPDACNHLVIGDTDEEKRYFDAFVAYAVNSDLDLKFVKKMIKALETDNVGGYNLKLCVTERDMHAGGFKFKFTARLMEERCKRILLVMSPDFVTTPMCEFQTEYALSLSPGSASKKILPVMYRPCTVPPGLKHIAGLYYTRDELKEWFWPRLGGSLVAKLQWDEGADHKDSNWGDISLPTNQPALLSSRDQLTGSSRPKPGPKKSGGKSSSSAKASCTKSSPSARNKWSGTTADVHKVQISVRSEEALKLGATGGQASSGDPLGVTGAQDADNDECEEIDPAAKAAKALRAEDDINEDTEQQELSSLSSDEGIAAEPAAAEPEPEVSKPDRNKKSRFKNILPFRRKKKDVEVEAAY